MTESRASALSHLIAENAGLIDQGVTLITSIDPNVYRANTHEYFSSGVGRHFRHVLDFYDRFLDGLGSTIDYEARRRDTKVESDPSYAASRAAEVAAALESLAPRGASGDTVRVRCEVLDPGGAPLESDSSLERELAFLASHAIHHYAIIGLILRIQGVQTPAGFGVAPSTLRHRASRSR